VKRFAAFALVGSFPLFASAAPPAVSVYPPAPTTWQQAPAPAAPNSLNQPLSAAVQSAAATLPPAPVMSSTPSWGSPAVYPSAPVAAGGPCGDAAACNPVRPYFNALAPRGGCDTARGTCFDRFKEWLCFRSSPGGHGCSPVPAQAPLRSYFRTAPGCGTGACGTAGATACSPRVGRGDWAVDMPVQKLDAGCDTGTCRPRVRFTPLTTRSEVPVTGCDSRPARPRLFDRLFGFFTPRWAGMCGDGACAPSECVPTAPPFAAPPATAAPVPYTPLPMTPPQAMPVPPTAAPAVPPVPMSTTPVVAPPGGKANGKTIQLSPQQPFTNP
jgi:hypothetical protein